ncbi:hypothetical protein ABK040_013611 [Willaertia magna]
MVVEEPTNTFTLKAKKSINAEKEFEEPKPRILTQEEWIDLKNEVDTLINNTAIHLQPRIVAYSVVITKYDNNRNPSNDYELNPDGKEATHLIDKLNTLIRKRNESWLCKIQ